MMNGASRDGVASEVFVLRSRKIRTLAGNVGGTAIEAAEAGKKAAKTYPTWLGKIHLCKLICFRPMNKIQILLSLPLLTLFLVQCSASRKISTANKNAETVRTWFEEGWNKNRNEDLIERVFTTDWSDGNPLRANQTDGHEGIRQLVKFYNQAFSETHFTITHLLANENQVAIRYDVKATHVGDAFGIAATGKRFTSSGIVIYEMEKGKIKRSWQELDLMGIIKQLKAD